MDHLGGNGRANVRASGHALALHSQRHCQTLQGSSLQLDSQSHCQVPAVAVVAVVSTAAAQHVAVAHPWAVAQPDLASELAASRWWRHPRPAPTFELRAVGATSTMHVQECGLICTAIELYMYSPHTDHVLKQS